MRETRRICDYDETRQVNLPREVYLESGKGKSRKKHHNLSEQP